MTIVRLLRQFETRGSRTVDRVLSSAIAVADANILSLLRGRVVGDNLTLADAATATYVPGGGGGGAPTPSGTILRDTRAGGAQSYQNQTTIAGINGRWDATRYTNENGILVTGFFEPDIDGSGTNARGFHWDNKGAQEQEALVGLESGQLTTPNGTGWYTQTKARFGRRPGGAGTTPENFWTLDPANVNAHHKLFFWNRTTGTYRLYFVIRPDGSKVSIDGNNYSSPVATGSNNPYNRTGEILTLTFYFLPSSSDGASDGIVRVWLNDDLVIEDEAADIGNDALENCQLTATTFPELAQTQYELDTVVWY